MGDGGFLIGSVPGCDLRLPGTNLAPVICLVARHQNGASLRCHRLLTSGEIGVLEWSGLGGRTDTLMLEGMESFVVRGGLIAAQTLNYTGAYVAAA